MKLRTSSGAEPMILDLLSVEMHVGGKKVFTAETCDVGVTVEFGYTPGHPGRTWGRMEDAEEPIPAEIEIRAVRPALQVFIDTGEYAQIVLDAGADIRDLMTSDQLDDIEAELDKRIERKELESVDYD